MDRDQFWGLVEAVDATTEDGCERLVERLSALPGKEIEDFARILDELRATAYQWDLWGAAYVVNGGCSDDGFDYFRAWLVAQGRTVYEMGVRDPDSLAAFVAPDECENEALLSVAHRAYEASTGQRLPLTGIRTPAEPTGPSWDFDDTDEMRRRYPLLCQRVALDDS